MKPVFNGTDQNFFEGGDLLYYWILKRGLKKKRKLIGGLSSVFQRIGFKKLSGRYLGHWTVGNETSSPCQSTFWYKNISTHICAQEHYWPIFELWFLLWDA